MALPPQGFHPQFGGCLVGSEGGAVFTCNLDGSRPALQAFSQVLAAYTMKQRGTFQEVLLQVKRQSATTQVCLASPRHADSITNYRVDLPSFVCGQLGML